MVEKGRISSRQLAMLLFTMVITTADIYPPALVAGVAGRDAWLSVFMAFVYSLAVWLVAVALASRFHGQSLIHYSRRIAGPWLGGFLGLLFILFFFFMGFSLLRMLSDIMATAFMPYTPLVVFAVSAILPACYAVFCGLEVIARVNEILLPLGVGSLLFVGFGVLPDVDFAYFLPVLENGLGPVNWGAILIFNFLGEIMVVLLLYPHVTDPQRVGMHGLMALTGLGAALQIGVLAIGLFTPAITATMTYPALEMVRLITLGTMVTHLDVVMMMVWVGGIFIKLALVYYATVLGLAQWLALSDYRPLVAPVGVLMVVYSLLGYHTLADYLQMLLKVFPGYAVVHELLLPLGLLITTVVRGLPGGDKIS
nr:endospore germination permease [Desulfofundulus thermobenzoicus]